jgi:hypothetical protein
VSFVSWAARSGHYGRSSYKASMTDVTGWVFFRVFLRMNWKVETPAFVIDSFAASFDDD